MHCSVSIQILYDSQARSRSVSESASSDTTALMGYGTNDTLAPAEDSTGDTPNATGDSESANQKQEEVIEGVAVLQQLFA